MDDHTELRALLTRAADDVGVLHPPSIDLITRRYQRRRLVVSVLAPACAALVVLAIALVLVVRSSHHAPAVHRPDVNELKSFRWTTAPVSPLATRSGTAAAWTGSQLLLWGGENGPLKHYADGAAYDPATKTWAMLPPGPLTARGVPLSAWTGSQLFVWGGSNGGKHHLSDGALYDSATEKWTRVAPAPQHGDYLQGAAFAIGPKVLLLTAPRVRPYRSVTAALYDPAKNTWTREPTLHVQSHQAIEYMTGVAADGKVVLQFAWQRRDTSVGYTFNASTSRWVGNRLTLPARSLAEHMLWTGSRVLQAPIDPLCRSCGAVSETGGLSTDPVTGATTKISRGPLDQTVPAYVWTGAALLGVAEAPPQGVPTAGRPGATAAWNPVDNTWTALRSAHLPGATTPDSRGGVWTGSSLLVWTDSNSPGHLRVLQFAAK